MQSVFFELLQVAVGNRTELTTQINDKQWALLYDMFTKQAMLGIGFIGVSKLPKNCRPNPALFFQWVYDADNIKGKNEELNDTCVRVCQTLKDEGFNTCILKGQSNLINYPDELQNYRTPGDIDLWAAPVHEITVCKNGNDISYSGMRGVIEYVLQKYRDNGEESMPEVNYHHVDWKYDGVEVEVHFRPSWMNCPWHNSRLQTWCKENVQWNLNEYKGIPIPTVWYNVIYQLVHIYRHLFNEGIGLRQILDYYMVLKAYNETYNDEGNTDNVHSIKYINSILSDLGLGEFAAAVMWVLHEVFAIPDDYLLCEPNARRGKFLLNEIMLAGNFGKYDKRNIINKKENYLSRFGRRQKRFLRFLTQYPTEVIWGPYFSIKQRMWRIIHGWR